MKIHRIFYTFISSAFILIPTLVKAQNVPPPLIDNLGVNIQLIGLSINYEKVLKDNFTVNAAVNLQGGFFGNDSEFNYVFGTYLSAEPRYYYNRNRRAAKGKKLDENSGNFIAAELGYASDIITISNAENITINPYLPSRFKIRIAS